MPNIDQYIWNAEFLVVDIIKEFQQSGRIVIDLNNEGPDAKELGLYKLLDFVCEKFNIDKKLITIKTRNLLEAHADYEIVINGPLYVKETQVLARSNDYTHKNFDNIKHFGLFIGRSNWQRLWVSAEVFSKYRSQCVQTFLYDCKSDFHKPNLGVDRLINELQGNCDYEAITKLISSSPISVESVNHFPIITPSHFNIAKKYHEFLIEIVCETYTSGNSFYPTEKTWRPIVCKTPMIIQGPINFLKNLKKLGFKTFSQYWDESYDEDGQILGTKRILNNINRLSKMDSIQLQMMYTDMTPILNHNYNLMMELQPESFDIFK